MADPGFRIRSSLPHRLAATMALAVAFLFAVDGAGAAEPSHTVGMTNSLKFDPAELTVRAGDTVEWRNTSDLPHTVTADPAKAQDASHVVLPEGVEPFDSGMLQPGEVFRYTFDVPGRYKYFCIPHEAAGMIGEVVVQSRDTARAEPVEEAEGG